MGENEVTIVCGHCHQRVTAFVRTSYRWVYDEEFDGGVDWYVLQCSFCQRPSLAELDDNIDDPVLVHPAYLNIPEKWAREPRILYPEAKVKTAELPSGVADAYTSVLKVHEIDPAACVAMIRRTLEVVCADKQVKGDNLDTKLEHLKSALLLPPVVALLADRLRKLGNIGAHADHRDAIEEEDVPMLIDALELLLDFLYGVPRAFQKVEARANQPRTETARATGAGNVGSDSP